MTDIHCHILPRVDDGAVNERQALSMLEAARRAGVKRLVATPHVYDLRGDWNRIRSSFEWLRVNAIAYGVQAHLGYEVNYQVLPHAGHGDLRRLCMGDSDFLLLELPEAYPFPNWLDYLGVLSQNLRLIIAHPERYVYLQRQHQLVDSLTALGCELQIDADSFCAPLNSPLRRTAKWLLEKGLVSYIASDAHGPQDYAALKKAQSFRVRGALLAALDGAKRIAD